MGIKGMLATVILLLLLGIGPVSAQQSGGGPPDQVDQLAQLINLDDDQKDQIRTILEGTQSEIDELRTDALAIQQELEAQVGPNYDEDTIREQASRLGDLTGEMTALSILLQARVESVLTEEQRSELERQIMERQMQQRMQPPAQ